MEMIQEWVRNIFILLLALTFIETLLPSTRIQPYIRFVFSIVIMSAVLTPLTSLLE